MDTVSQLIASLSSDVSTERNKAAIASMDIGDARAVAPLVAAIEDPKNRTARGTLIYALSAFDCTPLFMPLFRWAIEGGYEVAGEAISILEEQELEPSVEESVVCHRLLDQYVREGASTDYKAFVVSHLEEILGAD